MNNSTAKGIQQRGRGLRGIVIGLLALCGMFPLVAQANVLDVNVSGGGQVVDSGVGVFCTSAGEPTCQFDSQQNDVTVNLVATPQPGWLFAGWGGECAIAGANPNCALLVMGDPAGPGGPVQSVVANFVPDNVSVTVVLAGSGQGSVQSDAANPGIDCPADCSENYLLDRLVTLTAMPASPTSVFTGWGGVPGCTGLGPCNVPTTMAQTVTATFENDADSDGVFDPADLCPNTPLGESVDANGCGPSQLDDDNDGVTNDIDQCPNTPVGEPVDANGCAPSQLDDDGDGVTNDIDQCPNTPAGEIPDAQGCGPSQQGGDDDNDGVDNAFDQCPNTPAGEVVDANGCSGSQLDGDGDGVTDDLDQCPVTPAGATVDATGCAASERDTDGDGLSDDLDQCPGTDPGVATDVDGCSETQLFGNELGELPGLGRPERMLGGRLDEICPLLVAEGDADNLTDDQQDLREACSRLKNRDTSEAQAADALDVALIGQLPALHDYMVELTHSQFRHLRTRIRERHAGGGSGASVAGINLRVGDEMVPAAALQSAFEGLLGMGASADEPFADFGKLGVFMQGDIDTGDRDANNGESGYDFDSWNLTFGADYRFSDTFFAGGSLSFGEVDVDYADDMGATDVEQWALSLYAGWQLDERWYLDALFSYGESDFDLERNVSYVDMGGTFDSKHQGATDGEQLFLGLNTGYTWSSGAWRFGPVASVAYLDGTIDSYTETSSGGSEAWNFIVDSRDIESLRVSAGAQLDYIINTDFGVLIPGLRASYVIETEDEDESIALRLANNPFAETMLSSDSIVVNVEARDDAFVDASFNLAAQFPFGVSGFFSYNFYSAFDNFSKDAYTLGLRWDKPF